MFGDAQTRPILLLVTEQQDSLSDNGVMRFFFFSDMQRKICIY